jgi:glycosyltransferase involved in cell wall biosynthesis
MRLGVVTAVVHYATGDGLYAYGPYARELDIWADLFEEVTILAPCRRTRPPGDSVPFTRPNITILPLKERGGEGLSAKLSLLFSVPGMIRGLMQGMARVDAIHVRCPGNLALLGVILAPLFVRQRIAKYAGQWTHYPGEQPTVRLQRWLLGSRWWGAPVTVYGQWDRQPAHVIPFFTSLMDADHMGRARLAIVRRESSPELRIVYLGRLTASKNLDVLFRAMQSVVAQGLRVRCTVVGEGPERESLERLATQLSLAKNVRFTGGVPHEETGSILEDADVLVLVSETEGWPKALAEAMAFGLVCIGSDRGLIPQMLGEGRGIVVAPGDVDALAKELGRVARDPERCPGMRERAAAWAQQYSLEGLREALRCLLNERWGTQIPPVARTVRAIAGNP